MHQLMSSTLISLKTVRLDAASFPSLTKTFHVKQVELEVWWCGDTLASELTTNLLFSLCCSVHFLLTFLSLYNISFNKKLWKTENKAVCSSLAHPLIEQQIHTDLFSEAGCLATWLISYVSILQVSLLLVNGANLHIKVQSWTRCIFSSPPCSHKTSLF